MKSLIVLALIAVTHLSVAVANPTEYSEYVASSVFYTLSKGDYSLLEEINAVQKEPMFSIKPEDFLELSKKLANRLLGLDTVNDIFLLGPANIKHGPNKAYWEVTHIYVSPVEANTPKMQKYKQRWTGILNIRLKCSPIRKWSDFGGGFNTPPSSSVKVVGYTCNTLTVDVENNRTIHWVAKDSKTGHDKLVTEKN
ncbi:MAG: hypothetical protein ACK5Y2_11145 [Bdellovibrionales bacterium]